MKILITGGAGFIGSNLALELQKNNNIMIIDNFSSGKKENLREFEGQAVSLDISKKFELKESFDLILHHASITETTFKPDEEMIRQNVDGFKNVLNLALKTNSDLIYASSAAVYGNGKTPMQENQDLQPLNAYAKSKVMIDEIAKGSFDRLKIIGLRYFNVFGPREKFKGKSSSMIYQFRNQLLAGKNPRLFKHGEQKRDHIYIKDIISANLAAIKSDKSGIYNAGTGVATTFNGLIKSLDGILGTKSRIEYFDNPITEVYQANTQADTRVAEKGLGFKPAFSLSGGIKDYMKFLEQEER